MREGMEEREAATGLSEAREAAEAIAELWNARPEAKRMGTPEFSIIHKLSILLAKKSKKFQNIALCLNLNYLIR